MEKDLYFDMDGTIADFYGVPNWLSYLEAEDTTPYKEAKPLFNFSVFARKLNRLQRNGYTINIISWGSKDSSASFLEAVRIEKEKWLRKHLPSVKWDSINVVAYGTPKQNYAPTGGILFDDNFAIVTSWLETSCSHSCRYVNNYYTALQLVSNIPIS